MRDRIARGDVSHEDLGEYPYDVVRYISSRSLRQLPGFTDFQYDFLNPSQELETAPQRVIERWSAVGFDVEPERRQRVLINPDGSLMKLRIDELTQQRDNRPVYLVE